MCLKNEPEPDHQFLPDGYYFISIISQLLALSIMTLHVADSERELGKIQRKTKESGLALELTKTKKSFPGPFGKRIGFLKKITGDIR